LGVAEILHKPITPDWKPVIERVRKQRKPDASGKGSMLHD
jgi:hypothetical protein